MLRALFCLPIRILNLFRIFDFLGPLAMRLYLFPVFWVAGTHKLEDMDNVIDWFANGLHLPSPELMAYLATYTEIVGAVCLLLGFAVRIISVPLMIVMGVAAYTVHWGNGWYAIAPDSFESTIRLTNFMEWLSVHFPQRYDFITELGVPVMLNNGIQFAATYGIMLLVLFFIGGGRFFSMDYWFQRKYQC